MEQEITLQHFTSFMEYHNNCFNDFVEYKDYEKLEEFIMLCEFIEFFRNILKSSRAHQLIEAYVIEIKNFAYTFNDYCDQYGYDADDYYLIIDYTDTVLSL